MKHYVITIEDNPKSVASAKRCIESGKLYGINIEMFPAVTPRNTDLKKVLESVHIDDKGFDEVYSRKDNCIAAFLSHFRLWNRSVSNQEEITVFEHDAVIIDKIPDFIPYRGCINLGRPSYGRFNVPSILGVGPLTSKQYLPGAHAYRFQPGAAERMVLEAQRYGRPTDVFLNKISFPFLQELYPWPVKADDSFTTIQSEAGCHAKHNYGAAYEII
jgi:hypothetical protein